MHQELRRRVAAVGLTVLAGCAEPVAPSAEQSCGEARSLPAEVLQTLPLRAGIWPPDERWAELAERLPGGFAGVFYDDGRPVLMLSRPHESAAAKSALASALPSFPVASAEVRSARWDFSQLFNWYVFLVSDPGVFEGDSFMSGDKDERRNRIVFGVRDSTAIHQVELELDRRQVPCDLVALEIVSPVVVD